MALRERSESRFASCHAMSFRKSPTSEICETASRARYSFAHSQYHFAALGNASPARLSGTPLRHAPPARLSGNAFHSHSIVAGGFELTSYVTRFTPRTSLMIRLEILPNTSAGNANQSAVMPSRLVTARSATTWS